ncbi:MAG: ArgE/DapE family deacylase [Planctomycetota bacterium]
MASHERRNDLVEKLRKELRGAGGEIRQYLYELIRAETVSPPGNEHRAAAVVAKYLDRWKVPYRTYEKIPGRTNLVARVGSRRGPKLAVVCHTDVVPAGHGWRRDPFTPWMEKGRVFGRGACDNKGQLAAILALLRRLKLAETSLPGEFILVCAADEECGSSFGMVYLLEKGFFKADAAIIPDIGHNMKAVSIAEKGLLDIRVTAHGRQAHGSAPHLGVSAIWGIHDFLAEIRAHPLKARGHSLLSPPTCNVGVIRGGDAANMVPAQCDVVLNIRYLPSQTARGILAEMRRHARKAARRTKGVRFDLTMETDLPPVALPASSPVVRVIRDSSRRVLGREPRLIGLSGTTVAKQFMEHGIPAVGFSPGDASAAHVANESVSLDELVRFAAVMGDAAVAFLGGK